MDLERRTLIEILVSVVSVGIFVAALIGIGVVFSSDGIGEQGALALIGVIVLFILLMTGIGYWLSALEA